MNKIIAAIDLGSEKTVCIVGEKTPVGVQIIGYSETPSQGILRGEVVNIKTVLNAVNTTVERVNEQINTMPDYHPRQVSEVYVGISGQSIRNIEDTIHRHRSNPNSLITEEEEQQMIDDLYNTNTDKGEKVLHVIPQSYNVDEIIGCTEIVGMDGSEVDGKFKIYLGKESSIAHTNSVLSRANLKIKRMILNPIASAEATLTDDEKELGVVMVDIGCGTSDVLIYYEKIIRHIAILPFGGNVITNDIRQTCGVSYKNAELLKRQHGSCLSELAQENKYIAIKDRNGNIENEVPYRLLASTIEARVCEIIASVMHQVEIAGYKDKVRTMVITGGSSSLNHIQSLAKELSGLKVRLALPGNPKIQNTSITEIYKPNKSTAVGLILLGLNDIKDDYIEEDYTLNGEENFNENGEGVLFPIEHDSEKSDKVNKIKSRGDKKKDGNGDGKKKKKGLLSGLGLSNLFNSNNDEA